MTSTDDQDAVPVLALAGPDAPLSPEELLARKEHLMNEITATLNQQPQPSNDPPRRRSRRKLVIAGATTAVVLGIAAPVAADTFHIWRQDDGSVAIDGSSLAAVYRGHTISNAELLALQDRQHVSMVSNRELACQGITLVFDTDDQADAYIADFETREKARKTAVTTRSQAAPTNTDPCAPYASSPDTSPPDHTPYISASCGR